MNNSFNLKKNIFSAKNSVFITRIDKSNVTLQEHFIGYKLFIKK